MNKANLTFYERASDALANPSAHQAIRAGARKFVEHRATAVAAFPEMDTMRDRARLIRAHTLSSLDVFLAEFADNVEANGGCVFWAKNATEANDYIVKLAGAREVRQVVKSKSMVTEEIELNHALEAADVQVVESDLGEFIIQLAGEKPSHILAPALHKTRAQVGQLFEKHLNTRYTDDPFALNEIARAHLRDIFLSADMGISGVNFGVSESGTVSLVTNEGNGRLTTSAPRIHVALMGMERLVPTLADLATMLPVLAVSATGQKLTVYNNLITGPRRPGEPDGPEELHVVILDNGRSDILATEVAEILYCIRCGACLNVCPVYQSIGGHAYGSVYSGPVGSVVTPALMGLDQWHQLPHASTLCGACKEICPIRIDIPRLLLQLRNAGNRAYHSPAWLRTGMRTYRTIAQRPFLFRLGLRIGSVATRLLAKQGWLKVIPSPLSGWTDHRAFPELAKKSFRQLWAERKPKEYAS